MTVIDHSRPDSCRCVSVQATPLSQEPAQPDPGGEAGSGTKPPGAADTDQTPNLAAPLMV